MTDSARLGQLREMIEDGRLCPFAPTDEFIIHLWSEAEVARRDSLLDELSAEGCVGRTCDAARCLAVVLLAVQGYRAADDDPKIALAALRLIGGGDIQDIVNGFAHAKSLQTAIECSSPSDLDHLAQTANQAVFAWGETVAHIVYRARPNIEALADVGRPLLIHLVHGTWPFGWLATRWPAIRRFRRSLCWFEEGSGFRSILGGLIEKEDEVVVFSWSGRNSFRARAQAATALKDHLAEWARRAPHANHVVIAHSHGGSVAHEALGAMCPGQWFPRLGGLMTLGTPFVTCWQPPLPWEWKRFHLWVARWTLALSCLVPMMVSASLLGLSNSRQLVFALIVLIGISLWMAILVPMNERKANHCKPDLAHRLPDSPLILTQPRDWVAIRVPGDEAAIAINLLQITNPLVRRVRALCYRVFASPLGRAPGSWNSLARLAASLMVLIPILTVGAHELGIWQSTFWGAPATFGQSLLRGWFVLSLIPLAILTSFTLVSAASAYMRALAFGAEGLIGAGWVSMDADHVPVGPFRPKVRLLDLEAPEVHLMPTRHSMAELYWLQPEIDLWLNRVRRWQRL